MSGKYQDKSVLVTGGARGLGMLIALDFAKQGANVAVSDIREKDLQSTAAQIEALGVQALPLLADLSTKQACEKMVQDTTERFGKIDILVNNVGIVFNKDIIDNTDEEIEKTVQVNLMGQIRSTRAVLPQMVERKSGIIVSIASGAGKVGLPAMGIYCSTKFGLIGFFDSLRHEMRRAETGVRVIVINPGYMATKMFVGAKIPRMTKLFDPQQTSTALMKAIDKGKEEVFIPKNLRGMAILRGLYPPWLMEKTIELTGMHESFYTSKTID